MRQASQEKACRADGRHAAHWYGCEFSGRDGDKTLDVQVDGVNEVIGKNNRGCNRDEQRCSRRHHMYRTLIGQSMMDQKGTAQNHEEKCSTRRHGNECLVDAGDNQGVEEPADERSPADDRDQGN